ncbi:hypothetical protein [Bdellovibrio reynosensis]|uniref:Uncharacterized protein n=1 Tax=Bdellovibrio reynosensis TaxID=2835041 RepID=A0ABY4C7Y0_9BACT|nr:hypothetical protein [Bdellovibrio reynosensis]UOF00017.1 hypothetical protein MNR06_09920 [Bdellovibrio reynosensis]
MHLFFLFTLSCAILPAAHAYPSRPGYNPFEKAATHEYDDTLMMTAQISDFVDEVKKIKIKPGHQKNLKHYLSHATVLLVQAQNAKTPEQVTNSWLTAISLRQEFRKYVRNYALL